MAMLSDSERMEIIRECTLEDDVFFSLCLENSTDSVSLILRIILGRDDLVVTEARTQRWMQNMLSRSVRLDVHATDRNGDFYNIEIQKDERRAERKRARYYSAMMDSRALGKGEDYSSLPESYVIFITRGDALGRGYALNRIDRTVAETGEPFGDGTHIVYVSSELADGDTELGKLMHDLRCTDPDDMHYNELRDMAAYYKTDEEGIEVMSGAFERIMEKKTLQTRKEMTSAFEKVMDEKTKQTREEGIKEGEANGLRKGRFEGREAVARSMIADGVIPLSKIAEYSGLTLSEVEGIRNSLQA